MVCSTATGNRIPRHLPAGEELDLRELRFTQTEHVLLALAKVVEQRDEHTAGHCERLAVTAVALGVAMNLDSAALLALYLGGFLHDVGKVGIPDSILFKPGKLNGEEWKVMRTHAGARRRDLPSAAFVTQRAAHRSGIITNAGTGPGIRMV